MIPYVKELEEILEKYKKENAELKRELAECKDSIETMKKKHQFFESIPTEDIYSEKEDQNEAFDKLMTNLEAMETEWKEDLAEMIDIIEPKELGDIMKLTTTKDKMSRNKENKDFGKIINKLMLFKCDQCKFVCNTKDERIQHHITMHQKSRGKLLVFSKALNQNKDDLDEQNTEEYRAEKEDITEENLT